MKSFKFKGDWVEQIELTKLSKLNSDKFFGYDGTKNQKELLSKSLITVRIDDEIDDNPDPRIEQINAINFILNNEDGILNSIFLAMKNVIYPFWKLVPDMEINDYWFPKLEGMDDLYNILGMSEISISNILKDNLAYSIFYFRFSVDMEHGLAIVMYGDEFVEHESIGDLSFEKTVEHSTGSYEDYIAKINKRPELKIYDPHPKYGKLKPWQITANEYYPFRLLHNDRNEELKIYLNNNPDALKKIGANLLQVANYYKKIEIINYLNKVL